MNDFGACQTARPHLPLAAPLSTSQIINHCDAVKVTVLVITPVPTKVNLHLIALRFAMEDFVSESDSDYRLSGMNRLRE